jgi:hypothetical protein
MLVRHLRLLVPAIAFLLLVATVARADIEKLAKHLHKLDPGGTGNCSPGRGMRRQSCLTTTSTSGERRLPGRLR